MFYSVESEMKMVFCWLPKIRTAYPIIWDDLLSMFQYDINAQGLNASLFVVFYRRKNKAYLVHLENDNNKYYVLLLSGMVRLYWGVLLISKCVYGSMSEENNIDSGFDNGFRCLLCMSQGVKMIHFRWPYVYFSWRKKRRKRSFRSRRRK